MKKPWDTVPLRYHAIPEAELDAMLDRPFYPPVFSEAFTPEDFAAEYWKTHSAVMDALSILGSQEQCGDGDFCANDDFGYSRFIGIEFCSKRMWRPELLPLIQTTLQKQTQPFCVYLEHDLLDDPDFSILVHPTEIFGYIPTAEHRMALGL